MPRRYYGGYSTYPASSSIGREFLRQSGELTDVVRSSSWKTYIPFSITFPISRPITTMMSAA